MRLKKCYINNFGKLSDFYFDFDDKLSVIAEDNGFGKTTLCAFIKAMFYGFSATRSKDLSENERLKYTPWQGGIFGGFVEFDTENGEYRIERIFGAKASLDELSVYNIKTGSPCEDFGENIGEELFGIDRQGFERCIFFSDEISYKKMPMSVSSKLSNLLDNTDDLNDYESAVSSMQKRARQYKTIGNRGIIADTENKIIEVQRTIDEAAAAKEQLEILTQKNNSLAENKKVLLKELENTRALISKNASVEVVKQKIKHYNSLVENYKDAKESIAFFENKYGVEMPNEQEISEFSARCTKLTELSRSADPKSIKKNLTIGITVHIIALLFAVLLLLLGFTANRNTGLFFGGVAVIAVVFISDIMLYVRKKRNDAIIREQIEEITAINDSFLERFNFDKENKFNFEIVEELESDLLKYKVEKAKFDDYYAKAKQYYKQENLKSVKQDIASKTPDELIEKEKSLLHKLDSISEESAKLYSDIEKLNILSEKHFDLVYKKERLEKELKTYNENYNALQKGIELLSQAKESLSAKYKDKIEISFKEKLGVLSNGKLDNVLLSTEFDVSLVDKGFTRDIASYSKGTRALIEFTMRLALCEVLFEKEKAFIILDDPFSSLDDQSFIKMSNALKKLSENTQIIYFTCTKSRAI